MIIGLFCAILVKLLPKLQLDEMMTRFVPSLKKYILLHMAFIAVTRAHLHRFVPTLKQSNSFGQRFYILIFNQRQLFNC